MYLFVHYICFYSNIFGFETKKVIPFHEITIVRRAKTAGIFPNAIEILAGERKYFFASFLSRDEAFKLINDGWVQHGNGSQGISEQQDLSSETSSPENGPVVIEKVNSSNHHINKQISIRRDEDVSDDSKQISDVENDLSTTQLEKHDDNVEQDAEPVVNVDASSSTKTLYWKIENYDAPKIPECFTKVAETKFLMKVEEFFYLFFSDDAVNFTESFHRKCGDKEFRCASWKPHDEFGHARDVSFQHPIKIYFGPKFGSCAEIQKFRVYKNSHLVIATSQEINDVPYGDYFCVEGLWDVERYGNESKEGCILRVYVNVAFSKKTVWKGKIVQSTLEECREAYEAWIGMAHDLLKQKNLEKQEDVGPTDSSILNGDAYSEREVKTGQSLERLSNINDQIQTVPTSYAIDTNQQVGNLLQGSWIGATAVTSLLRESMTKFCAFLRRQNPVSLILVIAFAVIILMQVSIVVLLNRPQYIHVASPSEYLGVMGGGWRGERSAETTAWLEKRMHHLKDEMLMVEAWLERMGREYAFLKAQFKDLGHLHR
ncbi:protein VASCULAR ASSOCIATED DEATH 1, chloroplastic-like isoform X2 [Mangifera indica]|nr:protein VASCULAR ASSOCIATED DEATH 1, chloroplastic-like isoform X2 [Mangifera indica]XP_044503063.1 protein VASCULAR ASSOCIATED DEATH 1, chloroplastic-like isoform X2 [Mangifera indica]